MLVEYLTLNKCVSDRCGLSNGTGVVAGEGRSYFQLVLPYFEKLENRIIVKFLMRISQLQTGRFLLYFPQTISHLALEISTLPPSLPLGATSETPISRSIGVSFGGGHQKNPGINI